MANRLDALVEKGLRLAARISDEVMVTHHRELEFQVRTEKDRLTRVRIWYKVREPDAAGQGGRVPLG